VVDDAQDGVGVAGLSSMLQQAAGDASPACLAAARPVQDAPDAVFEEELVHWLERLYDVRAERVLMSRLERLYGVGWLVVAAATLAAPMLGLFAAFTAVVALIATLGVGWTAATRHYLGRTNGRPRPGSHAPTTSADLPAFGPDERARLVRLMNLSRAAWRPATRMLLRAELRDARCCGALTNWGPLYQVEDVLLANPFGHDVE